MTITVRQGDKCLIESDLQPILRNLVPSKYQEIRGSLGITSGSFSPNLRSGLFLTTYPMLVEAVKHRISDTETEISQESVKTRTEQIAANRSTGAEANLKYRLLQQTKGIHDTIRSWREKHLQFVRNQIGISASLKGSPSAIDAIVKMIHGAHANDPIIPIYEGLTKRKYPQPPQLGAELDRTGFETQMGRWTAKMADSLSADVVERAKK